ncbi:MAG: insulinase family protein [Clostridia bacterium]|nr:insulinase family protein [Clostridia bacterium]
MKYQKQEIKKGINIHIINTTRFKTNLIAIFLSTPITKEEVTYNAVISSVLRRGSKHMQTQEQISKELENMYGAAFDCGIDKTGDNHILKFYLESINDKYLPQSDEKMLKSSCEKLLEIVFNPLTEGDGFKKEYVEQEKENVKRKIEGKIDNKARYAIDRCIEEMYKGEPYGLYKYGYIEDLNQINAQNLYEHYKQLIENCKIDIFISGAVDENEEKRIQKDIEENENIKQLKEREANYVKTEIAEKQVEQEKIITDSMEVTQGKLVLGLDVHLKTEEEKYITSVYNGILGGSATSKLFQEVREKASLAYTASSSFIRHKGNIMINCGIEIKNYEKALEIIRQQLEDIRNGNFTEEDLENSKKGIISVIKGIEDEQDTEITYYFGQELSGDKMEIQKYIETIEKVTKQNVIDIANKIEINTIYFLKD